MGARERRSWYGFSWKRVKRVGADLIGREMTADIARGQSWAREAPPERYEYWRGAYACTSSRTERVTPQSSRPSILNCSSFIGLVLFVCEALESKNFRPWGNCFWKEGRVRCSGWLCKSMVEILAFAMCKVKLSKSLNLREILYLARGQFEFSLDKIWYW